MAQRHRFQQQYITYIYNSSTQHIYTYVDIHMYICILYKNIYIHYIHKHIYIYTHIYIFMYIQIYIYAYVYTCTHLRQFKGNSGRNVAQRHRLQQQPYKNSQKVNSSLVLYSAFNSELNLKNDYLHTP